MKLFLDDVRDAPDDSWMTIRSPNGFLWKLMNNWENVTAISLDHDLGETCISGYDVLCAIEDRTEGLLPPFEVTIHSDNPVGIAKMRATLKRMEERSNHGK